jgi:hypothetical protein
MMKKFENEKNCTIHHYGLKFFIYQISSKIWQGIFAALPRPHMLYTLREAIPDWPVSHQGVPAHSFSH